MAVEVCILCNRRYRKKPQSTSMSICSKCRMKGPSEEYRCIANNIKGVRCGHWRLNGKKTCVWHQE